MPVLDDMPGFGRVELPDQWSLEQVARSSVRPAPQDWEDRFAMAIGQPAAGAALEKLLAARRRGRVVIVVEDITRHSPLPRILDIILREVRHAGLTDDQIEIFFASGMHPPMTPQQAAHKLGPAGAGLSWRCNEWRDDKAFVRIGKAGPLEVRIDRQVASADLRILVSSVTAHLQAGFGGGYKMLLPGCASLDTIRRLHRIGVHGARGPVAGTDAAANPMRQAIDQAGALVESKCGVCFGIQYLLDDNDLPTSVAAGEVLPAQQMIAKQCAASCGIPIAQPADIVVASAYPRDFDLWQSFKGIANARFAARPSGVVLCLSRCTAGLNGMRQPRKSPVGPKALRRIIRFFGPDTLGSLITRFSPRMGGDEGFFIRMAIATLARNVVYLVAPTLVRDGVTFPGIKIFEEPQAAIESARRDHLGYGPQRVIAFPSAGATYALPT
jgi:nickel-dependent lactate racemase